MKASRRASGPSALTKPIGLFFTAVNILILILMLILRTVFRPDALDLPRTVGVVTLGFLVGIAYLVGGPHPIIRLVPSVLWIAVVGLPALCIRLGSGPWQGTGAAGSLLVVIYQGLLVGALVYHAVLDGRSLLGRSRQRT